MFVYDFGAAISHMPEAMCALQSGHCYVITLLNQSDLWEGQFLYGMLKVIWRERSAVIVMSVDGEWHYGEGGGGRGRCGGDRKLMNSGTSREMVFLTICNCIIF